MRRYVIGAAIAGLAIAGMGSGSALARPSKPTPSGNMNLKFQGSEYALVSSEATTIQIDGLGQLIADKQGNLSGAETFTAVNSDSQTENVCSGSVSGSITPPSGNFGSGAGSFTANLTFTPGGNSGAYCFPSGTTSMALLCNRTLLHENLASELDAGTYRCVATGVSVSGGSDSINAATMGARIGITRGNNAPNS